MGPVPGDIKLRLEALSMSLGVCVVGLHSVRLVEDNLIDVLFDVEPKTTNDGLLHFRFPRPDFLNNEDHINAFCLWLASPSSFGETVH